MVEFGAGVDGQNGSLVTVNSMLRVAFDPSLRLRIEKDNLGQS